MKAALIAPCGMNCRLCYRYILPRNNCRGCNDPDGSKPKSCTNCKIVTCEKRIQNGWLTCADCDTYCQRLKDLDKLYRSKYHMSMIENLIILRDHGMDFFLEQQEGKFRCPSCGAIICVHQNDCPSCKKPLW